MNDAAFFEMREKEYEENLSSLHFYDSKRVQIEYNRFESNWTTILDVKCRIRCFTFSIMQKNTSGSCAQLLCITITALLFPVVRDLANKRVLFPSIYSKHL